MNRLPVLALLVASFAVLGCHDNHKHKSHAAKSGELKHAPALTPAPAMINGPGVTPAPAPAPTPAPMPSQPGPGSAAPVVNPVRVALGGALPEKQATVALRSMRVAML